MDFLRWDPPLLHLLLHVQPGSSRTGWAGMHGDRAKLQIQAVAQDHKANTACIVFLAKFFQVPKSKVHMLHGVHSRSKHFTVEGPDPQFFTEWHRLLTSP